jgi:hypothetical protein
MGVEGPPVNVGNAMLGPGELPRVAVAAEKACELRFAMAPAYGLFDAVESVLCRASSALRPVLALGIGGRTVLLLLIIGAIAAEAEIARLCPFAALEPKKGVIMASNAAVDFERMRAPAAPGRGGAPSLLLMRLESGRPSAAAALSARALGPNCEMSSEAKPALSGLGLTIPVAASSVRGFVPNMLCVRVVCMDARGVRFVWKEPRMAAAPPAADMDCQSVDTMDMRLSVPSFQAASLRASRRREKNT